MTREEVLNSNEYFNSLNNAIKDFEETLKPLESSENIMNFSSFKETAKKIEEVKTSFYDNYPTGVWKAYDAWYVSTLEEKEVVIFEGFLYPNEYADFVETLMRGSIEEFYYLDESPEVMNNIYGFIENGCSLKGPIVLEENGVEGIIYRHGLSFQIGK